MGYGIMEYSNATDIHTNNTVFFMPGGDPFIFKHTVDSETRLKNRNTRDPEQAPRPEPGDQHIIMATVIGVIVGCIAGVLIGYNLIGPGAIVPGIVGGIIAGGFLGASIGNYLKKRARRKRVSNRPPYI